MNREELIEMIEQGKQDPMSWNLSAFHLTEVCPDKRKLLESVMINKGRYDGYIVFIPKDMTKWWDTPENV